MYALITCAFQTKYFQAFTFVDQNAADHYRSLREELNPRTESSSNSSKVFQTSGKVSDAVEKDSKGIKKQVLL